MCDSLTLSHAHEQNDANRTKLLTYKVSLYIYSLTLFCIPFFPRKQNDANNEIEDRQGGAYVELRPLGFVLCGARCLCMYMCVCVYVCVYVCVCWCMFVFVYEL